MTTQKLILYKDFNMTKPWSPIEFEVDFKDDKARVHDNSMFSSISSVSRFNKLSVLGGIDGKSVIVFYGLTVNGCKAYFKSNYQFNK